jgi:hypothetical protein
MKHAKHREPNPSRALDANDNYIAPFLTESVT